MLIILPQKPSLAQKLTEQENIWRPATKYTEKHYHSIWPEHFRFGELLRQRAKSRN